MICNGEIFIKRRKSGLLMRKNPFDAMLPPQKSVLLEQIRVHLQQYLGIVPKEKVQEIWKNFPKRKGILKRYRIVWGRSHLIAKTVFKQRFMNHVLLC